MAAFIVQDYIIKPYVGFFLPILNVCVLILAMVEFKSIAENFTKATGVVIWDKVKGLFKRKVNDIIDSASNKDKEQ